MIWLLAQINCKKRGVGNVFFFYFIHWRIKRTIFESPTNQLNIKKYIFQRINGKIYHQDTYLSKRPQESLMHIWIWTTYKTPIVLVINYEHCFYNFISNILNGTIKYLCTISVFFCTNLRQKSMLFFFLTKLIDDKIYTNCYA